MVIVHIYRKNDRNRVHKKYFVLSNHLKSTFVHFMKKNGMTLRHDLLHKGMYKRSAEFEKLS